MKPTIKSGPNLRILAVEANLALIQSALDEIQGRAYADTLTAKDVIDLAAAAESAMDNTGIAASYRQGATFSSTPSGPSANAYKYGRVGTAVVLERKSRGWSLIRAIRVTVWPKQRGRDVLTITPAQKVVIFRLAMRAYSITLDEARSALDDLAKAA